MSLEWLDVLPITFRSVKGQPLTADEMDINFERIGTMLCSLIGGHDHDGVNSKELAVTISIDNFENATIIGGALQSSNWGPNDGVKIDLVNHWMKFGGLSNPKFSVNEYGVLTAIDAIFSGTISASNLTQSTIDIGGTDATSFHVDINGNIWSGAATFGAAPFSVSYAGALVASNAQISGTITGSVIRTSPTGQRVIFDTTGISGWNSSGAQTIDINVDGSGWLGLTGTRALSWTSAGAVTIAGFSLTGSTMLAVSGGNTTRIATSGNVFQAGPSASPTFYVTVAGALYATGATITGAIAGGTIDIGGADNTSFHVDADGHMWMGAATFGSAPFRVTNEGYLYASSANITGAINATSGTIGNWSITAADGIYTGSGTSHIQLKISEGIWMGADAFANAKFSVTPQGALKSVSGAIGGFTINNTDGIYSGDGATRVQMDPGVGIWCGHNTFGSAPFHVSVAGALYATGATISGEITAASGAIGGWTLGANSLTSTLAGIHSAGYAEGAEILLGHATAYASAKIGFKADGSGKLASGNISWNTDGDITMTGDFTSTATITGGTIQTAASGSRVVLDSSGIQAYNGGNVRAIISTDGSGWLGASNLLAWSTSGAVTIAGWTVTSSLLRSAAEGSARIELDQANMRISIKNAANASKIVMGYLSGITRNDASGTATAGSGDMLYDSTKKWQANQLIGLQVVVTGARAQTKTITQNTETIIVVSGGFDPDLQVGDSYSVQYTAADYGFWAAAGDKLRVDGDIEYKSGDWMIQHDGSLLIYDASGNTIIRLGTDTAKKGLFLYDTSAVQLARFVSDEIYIGEATKYLQYTAAGGLLIRGSITADAGYIGGSSGWAITAGKMTSTGTGISSAGGDATYAFWAGDNTPASAPFSVTHGGALKSTSGAIGGFTIAATQLYAGTTTDRIMLDSAVGIHMGAATFAAAPFSVTKAGALIATNATIGGALTAGTIDIGTNSASLVDAAASVFTSGVYSWTNIGGHCSNVSNQLVITYHDGSEGARTYLRDSYDLTQDLVVGRTYRITLDAKSVGGTGTQSIYVQTDSAIAIASALTTTLTTYTLDFVATSTTANFIFTWGQTSGNAITIDNFYVYEVKRTAFHVNATGNIWIGSSLFSDAPFSVSNAGALTASSATITGDFKTSATAGTTKGIWLKNSDNSLNFYGNRGDTTIELLVSIGIDDNPYDAILNIGSANNRNGGIYVETTHGGHGIYVKTTTAEGYGSTAIQGESDAVGTAAVIGWATGATDSFGVWGHSDHGWGVYATGHDGYGLYATSVHSYAIYSDGKAYFDGNIEMAISHSLDFSGATVSLAEHATYNIASQSGILIANNHTDGTITMFIFGGGSVTTVASASSSTCALAWDSGTNYVFTSHYAGTATWALAIIKTRAGC